MHYEHILCAVGLGSRTSDILEQAAGMAQRVKAKLSVVHVIEHTPVIYGAGELSIPLDNSLEEKLSEIAQGMLTKYSEAVGITPDQQYLRHGSVKIQVIELAKEIKADLIVVGRQEMHGTELLLGSTANAILHAATCDVLAVQAALS